MWSTFARCFLDLSELRNHPWTLLSVGSDAVEPRKGLRFCISNMLPVDASAALSRKGMVLNWGCLL